jgi:hypothetical protein
VQVPTLERIVISRTTDQAWTSSEKKRRTGLGFLTDLSLPCADRFVPIRFCG